MAGKHHGVNISGGTLSIITEFPNMYQPAVQLADQNLVNPRSMSALLDGEWIRVGEALSQGNVPVVGTQRGYGLTTANIPAVTVNGGNDNDTITQYLDGARAIYVPNELRMSHGRKGRGDRQAGRVTPILKTELSFSYLYRLVSTTATYNVGDPVFVWEIPNAQLPDYVKTNMGVTRNVFGLVPLSYIASLGDAGLNFVAGTNNHRLWSVGRVEGTRDTRGWVRIINQFSLVEITGATN